MSVTEQEWRIIENALRVLPAQEKWTAATGEAYRTMLAALDAGQIMQALTRFAQSGEKWRPTWADLLRLAAGDLPDAPVFVDPDRAWALIEKATGRITGGFDTRFPERHQAAIDWLRTQDEAVAAWAARRGLRGHGTLGLEPVSGEPFSGAVRKRLADEYRSITDAAAQRVQLGKPAFPERAFRLASGGQSGGLAELVESLRPRRELPPGREAA